MGIAESQRIEWGMRNERKKMMLYGLEDVLLDEGEPEIHFLEPHESGGFVHFKLVVLGRADERMREAQPRQLLPELRHDVVEQEANAGGNDPHDVAEDRLEFGEDGAAMDAEDEDAHDDAHDGVRTQTSHHSFLHLQREAVTRFLFFITALPYIQHQTDQVK